MAKKKFLFFDCSECGVTHKLSKDDEGNMVDEILHKKQDKVGETDEEKKARVKREKEEREKGGDFFSEITSLFE